MVNVFGDSSGGTCDGFPQNIKVIKEVKKTSGQFKDHLKEIKASYKLGHIPYRYVHYYKFNGPCIIFTFNDNVFQLGADGYHMANVTDYGCTDTEYLMCWEEVDSNDGDGVVSAIAGPPGPLGPPGRNGPQGKRGIDGSVGSEGPAGKRGPAGEKGTPGIQGLQGDRGERGIQGLQGKQGPRGPAGSSSSTVYDPASKSYVIDMVEQATSLDCAFKASLEKNISVSQTGQVLADWKITKANNKVVQPSIVNGEFIISQPSYCATYLHCIAKNKTQEKVRFELYSRSIARIVDHVEIKLPKGELVSILLNHRIEYFEKISVRVIGKDLDFVVQTKGSRVEVTETNRWEAPELVVSSSNYPWPIDTQLTIANDIEKYQYMHIIGVCQHDDKFISAFFSPISIRSWSNWVISVEDKLILKFAGDGHKTLKIIKPQKKKCCEKCCGKEKKKKGGEKEEEEEYSIYCVNGVRCN